MRRDARLIETDEEPSETVRRAIISWLNDLRAEAGRPPLIDDWEHRPEEHSPGIGRVSVHGWARIVESVAGPIV